MKINPLSYAPSWQASLTIGGPILGTIAGVASRALGSASWLVEPSKDLCSIGFGNVVLDWFNWLGQGEIKTISMAGSVLAPFLIKASYSEKKGVREKVADTWNQNVTTNQKIAGGLIGAAGLLGIIKPTLKLIYLPFASTEFIPSGHFCTKILTSALGLSVTKSLSKNSSREEKRALITWCAFNAMKDAILLTGTIANHCHSLQEVAAGSLVALTGVAAAYYLLSDSENQDALRIKIQCTGSDQFRVVSGDEKALIDSNSQEIVEGALSANTLRVALLGIAKHQTALQENHKLSLVLTKKGLA